MTRPINLYLNAYDIAQDTGEVAYIVGRKHARHVRRWDAQLSQTASAKKKRRQRDADTRRAEEMNRGGMNCSAVASADFVPAEGTKITQCVWPEGWRYGG